MPLRPPRVQRTRFRLFLAMTSRGDFLKKEKNKAGKEGEKALAVGMSHVMLCYRTGHRSRSGD